MLARFFGYGAGAAGIMYSRSCTVHCAYMHIPQLNKFTKSHRHDKPGEAIVSTNTTDFDDTASGEMIQIFQNTSGSPGTFQVPT